jgi:hypothetical protein
MKTILIGIAACVFMLHAGCGDNRQEENQKQSVVHTKQTEPRSKIPVTLSTDEFEGMKLLCVPAISAIREEKKE